MNNHRLILLFLFAILVGFTLRPPVSRPAAQPVDFPALESYITAQMEKHGLQGVAVAVTEGSEIIYQKGFGTAGSNRPMTTSTPMYIGSQSKSFTALALVQLAEQGLVDLSAPVRDYIPWFSVADPQASERITISHLLHHTSGLAEAGYSVVLPDDASLEEGVRSLSNAQLIEPVGTKFQYFNMGYCVLKLVIETVSGQTYEEYVQQRIFTPLGMTKTFTQPAPARAAGLSQGYSRFFGFTVPVTQPHPQYQVAQGFIISTAEDMARYAIAMSHEGVYDGQALAQPASIRKLFQPVQGYGLGWFIAPDHISHGGANETFKTFVDLYPKRDLGIVLLINQGYLFDHYISAEQLFAGVSAIVLGNPPPPVSQGVSVRVIGWGIGLLVIALAVLHTHNILQLRTWRQRVSRMSPIKLAVDVFISFLIPTVILIIVYSQLRNFFDYRFNLVYQLTMIFKVLPDIAILLLVSAVPDYSQALLKLIWVVTGKARPGLSKNYQVAPVKQ